MDWHRPPHILLDNNDYFITARTYMRDRLFETDLRKDIVCKHIAEAVHYYQFKVRAWVILDNHYHIIISIKNSLYLPRFIRKIHSTVAIQLNKFDGVNSRQTFYQYWDVCIRSEAGFWRRINYIHHNPVKHRLVKDIGDYRYSSYRDYLYRFGKEWMRSCFQQYPIIDFTNLK